MHCTTVRSRRRTLKRDKTAYIRSLKSDNLELTAANDGGLDSGADGTGGGAKSLNLLHDVHGGSISDLTENDVLAIEPRGDNGGDEELGAVAAEKKTTS